MKPPRHHLSLQGLLPGCVGLKVQGSLKIMNLFRGAVGIAMKASRLGTVQGVGILELTVRGCGPITADFGQIWPLEQKN